MNIVDHHGYQLIKRHRRLGQYTPEILAVDDEGSRDSIPRELSQSRF